MRTLVLTLAAGMVLAQSAAAQPRDGDRPPRDRDPLARLLAAFDADDDGALSAEEIQAARDARAGRLGRGAQDRDDAGVRARRGRGYRDDDSRRGPPGARDDDARTRRDGDRRARDGQGPPEGRRADFGGRARRGRVGDAPPFGAPVRAERVFARADRDGDGQLSIEEFTGFLRQMPRPGARGPQGPRFGRFDGRGDFGPPRGDFRRTRPDRDSRPDVTDRDGREENDREDND